MGSFPYRDVRKWAYEEFQLDTFHSTQVCATLVICAACWHGPRGAHPGAALGTGIHKYINKTYCIKSKIRYQLELMEYIWELNVARNNCAHIQCWQQLLNN